MNVLARMMGRVRGKMEGEYAPDTEGAQIHVNTRGDVLVAQALPELTSLVAMGNTWGILSASTAALTGVPTTTAGHTIWNGEPPAGKCYAIDSFGALEIVTDATQQNSIAIFALNEWSVCPYGAPTDAALTKASMSGRKYGGRAKSAAGGTVVDDGWQPHGPSTPANTAFAGAVWRVTEALVRGLYLVQPGGKFSVAAAKTVATASQIRYFIRWHEVQLPVVV